MNTLPVLNKKKTLNQTISFDLKFTFYGKKDHYCLTNNNCCDSLTGVSYSNYC